jgi:pimeloyl-ACP methyl ester carboxylesterase
MRSSLALIALTLAGCATTRTPPARGLHSETFGSVPRARVRSLVIVVHGDGAPAERADEYAFARAAAATIPASAAVAILRPGYSDAGGRLSPGDRGAGNGDNYTPERITAVGDAIATLQRRYPLARTILVGESGGAAIVANLAGTRPALVDGMVLVSCPCKLPEWRKYMAKLSPAGAWNAPVASLDPLQTAGGIRPAIRTAILVGGDDKITPTKFSRAYAEALTLRGIATDYRILPGKGQGILNEPDVLAATGRLAAALPGKP